jgi:GNAT superfamily N-acetyltransferase
MLPSGYAVETYESSRLSESEMGKLIALVHKPFLWFAPSSTYADMVKRLKGHESSVVDVLLLEGKPCGFGTCAVLDCAGASVMYRGGTVIEEFARSKGLYRALIELALERCKPEYLMTRTQNPRVYEAFSRTRGVKRIFPQVDGVIPDHIAAIAQCCPHDDWVDPTTLIVPGVYAGELREDRSFMTARSDEVQSLFRDRLKPDDAFMVVAEVG